MVRLVMRRKGLRLECPSEDWDMLLTELPESVDLNVVATKARSLSQLGTYWGLLSFVIEHGPEWIGRRWMTKDELSDALQLEVGFVRQISLRGLPEGSAYAVPASKSFSECSHEHFTKFFNLALDKLTAWCGYDPMPLYVEWLKVHGRRRAMA